MGIFLPWGAADLVDDGPCRAGVDFASSFVVAPSSFAVDACSFVACLDWLKQPYYFVAVGNCHHSVDSGTLVAVYPFAEADYYTFQMNCCTFLVVVGCNLLPSSYLVAFDLWAAPPVAGALSFAGTPSVEVAYPSVAAAWVAALTAAAGCYNPWGCCG